MFPKNSTGSKRPQEASRHPLNQMESSRPNPQPVRQVSPLEPRMPSHSLAPAPSGPSLSLEDVTYTLFRHKWKIILCSLLGIAAAGAWLSYRKLPYVSDAKLLIRYVAVEGMSMRPGLDDTVTKSPDMRGETIISSEQQIITSVDLLKQVAQAVGPEKILAKMGGGNELNAATVVINNGLTAEAPKFSSVIALSFRHPDPEIVQPVLRELIALYFKKHVEVHRASGLVGDFLAQETDQLRTRLAQTDEELRKAKAKAGVVSLEDAKKSFSEQMARLRDQVFSVQAELAEKQSLASEYLKLNAKGVQASTPEAPKTGSTEAVTPDPKASPPANLVDEYRTLLGRIEALRKREQELLVQFTSENPRVREVRAQLAKTLGDKEKLEGEHPQLTKAQLPLQSTTANARESHAMSLDPVLEAARITALEAKLKALQNQIQSLRSEVSTLETLEGTIQELMRKKELEEAHYRRYAASLEQSRINEAMGSGRVSNISQIQSPSPPAIDAKKTMKIAGGLAGGGIALGLAWAFLIELVIDRSIRRASDVEKKLRLPLFLTIPNLKKNNRNGWRSFSKRTTPRNTLNERTTASVPAVPEGAQGNDEANLGLQPFHDTLRDRLIGYFESKGLTHKPKLVAVTGLGRNAGVTTTAIGLAQSLSQTGDGNVLLVDLTPGEGAAHHFVRGKIACGFDEVFTERGQAQVDENLYVVAQPSSGDRMQLNLPHRFRHLVPKLKASDFDYIIFDMPPVSQISITPRLAAYMDMVLLVMESEQTDLDLSQRATELLAEAKTHLGVVLNKNQSYVPSTLHREYLGSA